MNTESLKQKIKKNEKLKWFIHWCIMSSKYSSPRLWVKIFVNPFFSKRGKGSVVKWSSRLNVSPINEFVLGRYSVIENYSTVDNGVGAVIIGDHTRVGISNTVIGPVTIGNDVIIAQNVVLSGLNHNYENPDIPIRKQGVSQRLIVVQDSVWIGANSTITAGVTIGTHSVVAGGSVVVRDVPPYSVCAGVPARVIKQYDFQQNKWITPTANTK